MYQFNPTSMVHTVDQYKILEGIFTQQQVMQMHLLVAATTLRALILTGRAQHTVMKEN